MVCFDGTWNGRRTGYASNVEHAASCLARSEREGVEQVVWYQPGVGTHYSVDRAMGGLFGFGISSAILSAYRFLSLNYAPGDEVSLLGFSRGAYAARSLANLIANPGLLWPEHLFNEVDRFWKAYGTRSKKVMSASHPTVDLEPVVPRTSDLPVWNVPVVFLGAFDTVGSLGKRGYAPGDHWHDMTLHPSVRVARHALAIDERRLRFAPVLWKDSPSGDPQVFDDLLLYPPPDPSTLPDVDAASRIKQVWFQGSHADVGGGATPWMDSDSLSTEALLWMLREAKHFAGLEINHHALMVSVGGMGNETEIGTDSSRWWWSLADLGRVTRQAVRPDPDFGGRLRRLEPRGADGVLVASTVLERLDENQSPPPTNLADFLHAAAGRGGVTAVTERVRRTRGLSWRAVSADPTRLFDRDA